MTQNSIIHQLTKPFSSTSRVVRLMIAFSSLTKVEEGEEDGHNYNSLHGEMLYKWGMKVVLSIKYTKTQVGTQHCKHCIWSFRSRNKFIISSYCKCIAQHMSNNQYCLQHVDNCHVRSKELEPTKDCNKTGFCVYSNYIKFSTWSLFVFTINILHT